MTFIRVTHREVILLPRLANKHRPLPAGHGARALAAQYRAAAEGCDAAVFMTDADTPDVKERNRKEALIRAGFKEGPEEVVGVTCVPMATSESWLLSDAAAWTSVAGSCPSEVPFKQPEEMWGTRDDPGANHPKQAFARACRDVDVEDSPRTRCELATVIDLQVLRQTCPNSFNDFYEQLEEIAA